MKNKVMMLIIAITFVFHSKNTYAKLNPEEPDAHLISCGGGGNYTVGFFNGIWTTSLDARIGLDQLKDNIGNQFKEIPIEYKIFYNTTDGLADIAEVFIQRANEIDESGLLSSRTEFVWDVIGDSNSNILLNFLDSFKSISTGIIKSLYENIMGDILANVKSLTAADYALQEKIIDDAINRGNSLLLVGHSQGNLFLNHVYTYVSNKTTADRYAAIHIAPASTKLNGSYTLSNHDFVINALRLLGPGSVSQNNISIDFDKKDPLGHSLSGTYLQSGKPALPKILQAISNTFRKLKIPETGDYGPVFRFEAFVEHSDYIKPSWLHISYQTNTINFYLSEPSDSTKHELTENRQLAVFMCGDFPYRNTPAFRDWVFDIKEGEYHFYYSNKFDGPTEEDGRARGDRGQILGEQPYTNNIIFDFYDNDFGNITKRLIHPLSWPAEWNNSSPSFHDIATIIIEKDDNVSKGYLWKIKDMTVATPIDGPPYNPPGDDVYDIYCKWLPELCGIVPAM